MVVEQIISNKKYHIVVIDVYKNISSLEDSICFIDSKLERYQGFELYKRVISRNYLMSYLAIKHDDFIHIRYNKQGRPFIDNLEYNFSFSYSKNVIAIAIAKSNVSIDIEYVDSYIDFKSILELTTNNTEQDIIYRASPKIRQKLFYSFFLQKKRLLNFHLKVLMITFIILI